MTNQNPLIFIVFVVALAGGCSWWVYSATPDPEAISAAKSPLTPLPTITLKVLDDPTFTGRVIYGTLPIDTGGVGRSDPFAGTE